jgi:hypothetical protein
VQTLAVVAVAVAVVADVVVAVAVAVEVAVVQQLEVERGSQAQVLAHSLQHGCLLHWCHTAVPGAAVTVVVAISSMYSSDK